MGNNREEFCKYVESFYEKERHSANSCQMVEDFCDLIKDLVPKKRYNDVYEAMMNVAVEFEEDGFVAGIRWMENSKENK